MEKAMRSSASFLLCAYLFVSFRSCDSFGKDTGTAQLSRQPVITGTAETDDWSEDANFEDSHEFLVEGANEDDLENN